jgi:hypothetical protein
MCTENMCVLEGEVYVGGGGGAFVHMIRYVCMLLCVCVCVRAWVHAYMGKLGRMKNSMEKV